tara:strand:- start:4938 stop:5633 length:696 start_codon:yes stop_codon:yes gene_type:complete
MTDVSSRVVLSVCLWLLGSLGAEAESPFKAFQRGHEQLEAKNYAMAIASFMGASESLETSEHRCMTIYNAANASFLQAKADEPLDPQSSLTYYRQAVKAYRACLEMFPGFRDAGWNLELTLVRLDQISRQIEDEMNQEGEESEEQNSEESGEEGESEASEDEGEGEYEESDEEGANEPSAQSGESNSIDLDAQDIPPPMVEPEDILQHEVENSALREKGKASKYKPVEKDW